MVQALAQETLGSGKASSPLRRDQSPITFGNKQAPGDRSTSPSRHSGNAYEGLHRVSVPEPPPAEQQPEGTSYSPLNQEKKQAVLSVSLPYKRMLKPFGLRVQTMDPPGLIANPLLLYPPSVSCGMSVKYMTA